MSEWSYLQLFSCKFRLRRVGKKELRPLVLAINASTAYFCAIMGLLHFGENKYFYDLKFNMWNGMMYITGFKSSYCSFGCWHCCSCNALDVSLHQPVN